MLVCEPPVISSVFSTLRALVALKSNSSSLTTTLSTVDSVMVLVSTVSLDVEESTVSDSEALSLDDTSLLDEVELVSLDDAPALASVFEAVLAELESLDCDEAEEPEASESLFAVTEDALAEASADDASCALALDALEPAEALEADEAAASLLAVASEASEALLESDDADELASL